MESDGHPNSLSCTQFCSNGKAQKPGQYCSQNWYMMVFDILTKEDLQQFKKELLEEIRQALKRENSTGSGDKEWLRSREVRKRLDISPGTLQNLRITGILPYKKIGGSMYYRSSDVDKMMEGGNGNG